MAKEGILLNGQTSPFPRPGSWTVTLLML